MDFWETRRNNRSDVGETDSHSPLAVKTESLLYLDQAEACPQSRTVATAIRMLGERFGETDAGRSSAWLAEFAECKRESRENYKDFWAIFARVAAKLEALGMSLGEEVIFNRSAQALRLPEGQLPIVFSSIET